MSSTSTTTATATATATAGTRILLDFTDYADKQKHDLDRGHHRGFLIGVIGAIRSLRVPAVSDLSAP